MAVLSPVLEGASFQKSYKRIYPQGWMTAHVTGYVSPVNKRDIEGQPDLRYLPETRIGRTGIERKMEPDLRGLFGFERVEVNAKGKPVRVLRDQQANPGADTYLSIDIEAQSFATERLRRGRWQAVPVHRAEVQEALMQDAELRAHVTMGDDLVLKDEKGRLVPPESGAVVVMDIQTGEVKVMVSTPGFDPNLFSNRLSVRDWQRMNTHPRTPLLNRTISGLYAPARPLKWWCWQRHLKPVLSAPIPNMNVPVRLSLAIENFTAGTSGDMALSMPNNRWNALVIFITIKLP